jgi:ABC-type bacteriocin/lantibiotic exporter with double-glycine peptidase domain
MKNEQIKKKISFKQMIKISLFSFGMFIKANKASGILCFIFEILARIVGVVDFLIIAKIIDVVVKILQNNSSIELVVPYLIFLVGFNFIASCIRRTRNYYRNKSSQYFSFYSDVFLYEYYKTLGVPVMEDPDKNNIITRGMNEIGQLPNLFFTFVGVIADVINVVIAGIAIFYFMPKLLLVAII